jgi:hypothetical protein
MEARRAEFWAAVSPKSHPGKASCRPTWCSSRSRSLPISETRTCHSRDANC